jgi:outer membrane protein assembly factor BamA
MIRILKPVLIILAGILFCTGLANAQEEVGDEQRHIREIRIHIANVYPPEKAEESSWASFTNRYHMMTRESVIRTQLLFKEGDVLDAVLLEASERSLRRFRFINEATVSVVPVDDQAVDVEVYTKDAWSLVPGMGIDGGGGLATVSVHLMELNLLGYGKKVFAEAVYENDVGTTLLFGYNDYQLFNSRWIGSAKYKTGPLIESYFLNASRPLYSPDSKWSYGGSGFIMDKIVRRFEDGEESDRFAEDQTWAQVFLKRSFGERYKKIHLKFTTSYKKADYSTLGAASTAPPPPDQANVTPSVSIDTEDIEWVEYNYIDKMGIIEDNWAGFRYGGKLGYGIPVEEGFELWDTRLFLLTKTAFAHQQWLFLNANVNSEVVRNTIISAAVKYYKKASGHTLATNLSTRLGYNLDASKQFTLGADSGLRGYPARAFTGERQLVLNLEDRQFWGDISIGPKLTIGTIVFVDAGYVWKEEEVVALDDMRWSAGFGFRIGAAKAPGQPILRIDLGWAIGHDSFAVSVGHEQQF